MGNWQKGGFFKGVNIAQKGSVTIGRICRFLILVGLKALQLDRVAPLVAM